MLHYYAVKYLHEDGTKSHGYHAISEGKLMRILLSSDKNMDELEFADWLYEKIYNDIKEQSLCVGGWNKKGGGVFTITDEANCMKRSKELTDAYWM